MHPSHPREDALARDGMRGLDDLDYLALMREWEAADMPTLVRPRRPQAPTTRYKVVAVLGVMGALTFVTWGIRHLRAAK